MEEKGIPVLVNLLSIAKYEQLPDYPIQLMARGSLYPRKNGKTVLKYTESVTDEDTGETQESEITMTMATGAVTMERTGPFSNTMAFSPGRRYEGIYTTPYGEMKMGIFTREVRMKTEPKKGFVYLRYQLDLQGNNVSTNELHLEYFSAKESNTDRKAFEESN